MVDQKVVMMAGLLAATKDGKMADWMVAELVASMVDSKAVMAETSVG